MSDTVQEFPIGRCARAALPVLIEARDLLYRLASPQATRLEERISNALAGLLDLAGDVQAYSNRWGEGTELSRIAGELAEATKEYDDIGAGRV